MPAYITFTQDQIDAIEKTGVITGTAVFENKIKIDPSVKHATLQHKSNSNINQNLANLPNIELLVLQKSCAKDILWPIVNHLNLTNKTEDLCSLDDLQRMIANNISRLPEMKTHPAFRHLKAIKVNFSQCKNFIAVLNVEYLHSPVNFNLPVSNNAQTLENLNKMFAQAKKNQALDSLITCGFFKIGNNELTSFLTQLSRFYLSDELQFRGPNIKELLAQSKGAWLLKHIPDSMN